MDSLVRKSDCQLPQKNHEGFYEFKFQPVGGEEKEYKFKKAHDLTFDPAHPEKTVELV